MLVPDPLLEALVSFVGARRHAEKVLLAPAVGGVVAGALVPSVAVRAVPGAVVAALPVVVPAAAAIPLTRTRSTRQRFTSSLQGLGWRGSSHGGRGIAMARRPIPVEPSGLGSLGRRVERSEGPPPRLRRQGGTVRLQDAERPRLGEAKLSGLTPRRLGVCRAGRGAYGSRPAR